MRFRLKIIGAFLLLSLLFLVYFYYLDRSQYLERQIRQTSQEIDYISSSNNHYLILWTKQRQLAQKHHSEDILYVQVSDEERLPASLQAQADADTVEPERVSQLSSLLFSQ